MSKSDDRTETWVVYKMTMRGKHSGMNAICRQAEWDAMELDRPGYHTLIQEGISNEGEAERLARGTLGDAKSRQDVCISLQLWRGSKV
jgi:L-asparaginase II